MCGCSEEVDEVLKGHKRVLRALYSRYRLRPRGGGLRPKQLGVDGFELLLSDASLYADDLTNMDARLAFLQSRMHVRDHVLHWERFTTLSFTDFLEVRVALRLARFTIGRPRRAHLTLTPKGCGQP